MLADKALRLKELEQENSKLKRPERRWSSAKVIEALADVMVMKGVPKHIRSDNGPSSWPATSEPGWPNAGSYTPTR